MVTKVEARIAVRSGIPMFIGPEAERNSLSHEPGKDVGTLFLPSERKLKGRKRWIAFSSSQGRLDR